MDKKILDQLAEKLDPSEIKQREGAFGKKLDYLETWYVIRKANEIFGFDGWSFETLKLEHIGTICGKDKKGNERFICAYRATARVHVGGTIRDGSGFGNGLGKDDLEAHELALKEAESDALKRAFMKFGNQFGLALYDKMREGVAMQSAAQTKRDILQANVALDGVGNMADLKDVWEDIYPLYRKLAESENEVTKDADNQNATNLLKRKDSLKEQFEVIDADN